jgi:hypothetical protein
MQHATGFRPVTPPSYATPHSGVGLAPPCVTPCPSRGTAEIINLTKQLLYNKLGVARSQGVRPAAQASTCLQLCWLSIGNGAQEAVDLLALLSSIKPNAAHARSASLDGWRAGGATP